MEILSALDLKKGRKATSSPLMSVTQPLQFITKKKKDKEWSAWNLDWLEWQGLKQIKVNARRFMKNYRLAEGIIDKTDYIHEPDSDMNGLVDMLSHQQDITESMELKFYPIIPNVVNTLMGEFCKRDKRVSFRATDEYTYNEILERKKNDIEQILLRDAQQKMMANIMQSGADLENPEVQQQVQQQLSPDSLKKLPEIEDFYTKNYQVLCEKWASRQHQIDEDRFNMEELEEIAFKDKLCTDREFWHFKMFDDDYDIEVWNPVQTFYQKSPYVRYISNAQYVGHIELMTAADVIDNYGWKMDEKQLRSLQEKFYTEMPGYAISGTANDGSFYNATKSHEWNVGSPSLGYRQVMQTDGLKTNQSDIINYLYNQSEDASVFSGDQRLFRVTTAYWKSQMKIGFLTKITEWGETINEIITEEYVVTDKPVYDNTLFSDNRKENLVFGEHIDWIWINQVWGGIKIGPNAPTLYGTDNSLGIAPMYIGINTKEIKPLKFQFKGENSIYGCKLPVEGRIFNERNTKSMSIVDTLKPFQIGYNIVNNQISDILASEIGTVVMIDQNALPKHSLGEDWGKGNYAKAYVAMKDFSILPLDTSIMNTENAMNFNHYQMLDMSQTQRLQSRIQLATYFKQQAYELVGISPQRMGTPVAQKTSATEAEQIQVGSFAQTENLFIEHSDNLMPRVHQMRTDLAQWYACNKPSVKMQMMTQNDERVNFEINSDDLLLRDIHVYCTTKANVRKILDQMKSFALQNNTTGASIYDLGKVLQADSLGTLNSVLKASEEKMKEQQQEQMMQQQQMQEQQIQAQMQEKEMEYNWKSQENEADRRKDILVAEIRASGYGAMMDLNENKQSDFVDNMTKLKNTELYQEEVDIKRDKNEFSKQMDQQKMQLKREELMAKREMKDKDLQIARENKNRYDFAPGAFKGKSKDEKK